MVLPDVIYSAVAQGVVMTCSSAKHPNQIATAQYMILDDQWHVDGLHYGRTPADNGTRFLFI
jgi:hypothetical protein